MANVLSKLNKVVSTPMKYYENSRNRKLYKQVYNNQHTSRRDDDTYCPNCECEYCKEKVYNI